MTIQPIISRACTLFLLTALLLVSGSSSQAQATKKLPPFRIVQANGKVFKAEQLPMGKPIVLIYFSPECGHCETLLNDLFKQASSFQKASLAFITHEAVEKVEAFAKARKLSKHPNMYAGTEGNSFFVRNYYNVAQTPFVVLHDKNGNQIKQYDKPATVNDLVKDLNKLK